MAELQADESEKAKTRLVNDDKGGPKKPKKRKVESNAAERESSRPPVKAQNVAAIKAVLQQRPVPVTQGPTIQLQKFNPTGKTTFLSLPAEIRNEIYSLALVECSPVTIRSARPYLLEPGLLATNRQVRSEVLGIWYGENVFEIDGSSPAVKFLRATSDNKLRALRYLHIVTTFMRDADSIDTRIRQLLREFEPRGLDKQAIRFMMSVTDGFVWANLAKLKAVRKANKGMEG